MRGQVMGASTLALSVALALAGQARAADYVVPAGTLDTSGKVLIGSDTLEVGAGATLSPAAGTAVNMPDPSTNIRIGNAGAIESANEAAILASGTIGPRTLAIANKASGTIIGTRGILADLATAPAASASVTITNAGAIRGTAGAGITLLGDQADRIVTSGRIEGSAPSSYAVEMGGGDDVLEVQGGATFFGGIDMGTGDDVVNFTGSGTIDMDIAQVEVVNLTGGTWTNTSTLTVTGFSPSLIDSGRINVLAGAFVNEGAVSTAFGVALRGGTGFENRAGASVFSVGSGVVAAEEAGVMVTNAGTISALGIGILTGDGDDFVTNSGTISGVFGGEATLVQLRGGDDTMVLEAGSRILGLIDGGDGADTLRLWSASPDEQSVGRTLGLEALAVDAGRWQLQFGETYDTTIVASGATLTSNGILATNLTLDGGTFRAVGGLTGTAISTAAGSTIVNSGILTGTNGAALQLGDGVDRVFTSGTIRGSGDLALDLGGGDDRLTVYSGFFQTIDGRAQGGAGLDTIALALDPQGTTLGRTFDADAIGFERLDVESGTWTIAGSQTYDVVAVQAGATSQVLNTLTAGQLEIAGALNVLQSGTLRTNGSAVQLAAGVSFENAGRIESSAGSGLLFGSGSQSFVNAGVVVGANGVAVEMGDGDDRLAFTPDARFVGSILGGAGTDTLELTDRSSSGVPQLGSFDGAQTGFERLDVTGGRWTLTGDQTYAAVAVFPKPSPASLTNTGVLTTGSLTVAGEFVNAAGASVISASDGLLSEFGFRLLNDGEIVGNGGAGVIGSDGDDTVETAGSIVGSNGVAIDLNLGNDALTVRAGASFGGSIDGGGGRDTITLAGTASDGGVLGPVSNFEQLRQTGGEWTLTGAQRFEDPFNFAGVTIEAGSLTNTGNLTADIANTGATFVNAENARVDGTLFLGGSGTPAIVLNAEGATIAGTSGGILGLVGSSSIIANVGTISGQTGVGLGNGDDQLINDGAIVGNGGVAVFLAGGDDTLTLTGNSRFDGRVLGGDGIDTVRVNGEPGDLITLAVEEFEALDLTGGTLELVTNHSFSAGTAIGDGTLVNRARLDSAIDMAGGTLFNAASGTISSASTAITASGAVTILNDGLIESRSGAGLSLGSGDDIVSTRGRIAGSNGVAVSLGDGDDGFYAATGATFGGTVDGGAGQDLASFEYMNDVTLALDQFVNFETLDVVAAGGTITLTGAATAAGSVQLSGSGTVLNRAVLGDGATALGLDTLINAGSIAGLESAVGTLVNTGTITARADGLEAIQQRSRALTLDNAGTISATGTAILLQGGFDDVVRNAGTIRGDVRLAAGDDRLVQRAGAILDGTADGGAGADLLQVDSTGDGSVDVTRFVGFERFEQIGTGTATYAGGFDGFDTVNLLDGTLAVAAGGTLRTAGSIAITAGPGTQRVVNNGSIVGDVRLGAGDDSFTFGPDSSVSGSVDGEDGRDALLLVLAGDRAGLPTTTNFETLGVSGRGTLALTLDQSFVAATLDGTGLAVTANGFAIDSVTGGAGDERLSSDTDIAAVDLGAGDDAVTLSQTRVGGSYRGGSGTDTLTLAAAAPILAGSASGFERIVLPGASLTVTGTLGAADDRTVFEGGAQQLTLAADGTIAGTVDLGTGDDLLRLTPGATLAGTISGGAGTDEAIVELSGATTLAGGTLRDFETLTGSGSGSLTFGPGTTTFARITAPGDVAVAAGAVLSAGLLTVGTGNDRVVIAGTFTGSIDARGGTDTLTIGGGTLGAAVAVATVTNVEATRITAGVTTVSGNAAFGTLEVAGGRLIGLAGSVIGAAQASVAAGATFGSAGTVNGNIAVAGTLSPGASPGTMTVNGYVALAAGSTTLFELSPTASDKLLVSGAVTIAGDATLQLVTTDPVAPGTSLDLIVATGGITGSFTTVTKPAGLFGFLTQDANRIRLLGQFRNDASLPSNVRGTIDYFNATIAGGATTTFLAALPQLVSASGGTDAAAFARLSPEAYASARQIAVENGLVLADAVRGPAFAPAGDAPGLFATGQAIGNWRRLRGDADAGTARAGSNGWGALGGLGWSGGDWAIGSFVGYLDSRQTLQGRGARNDADGITGGVHARYAADALTLTASVAYAGGHGETRRTVPGGTQTGRYALQAWTGDVTARYAMPLSGGWSLEPRVGATVIRATRGALTETGGAFGLTVARARDTAVFLDTGVAVGLLDRAAPVRASASLGGRWQASGRASSALASLAGGTLGLFAEGVERAPLLAVGALTVEADVAPRITLFGSASGQRGGGEHQEAVRGGVRVSF